MNDWLCKFLSTGFIQLRVISCAIRLIKLANLNSSSFTLSRRINIAVLHQWFYFKIHVKHTERVLVYDTKTSISRFIVDITSICTDNFKIHVISSVDAYKLITNTPGELRGIQECKQHPWVRLAPLITHAQNHHRGNLRVSRSHSQKPQTSKFFFFWLWW